MDFGGRGSATAFSSTILSFPKACVQSAALKQSQDIPGLHEELMSVCSPSSELMQRFPVDTISVLFPQFSFRFCPGGVSGPAVLARPRMGLSRSALGWGSFGSHNKRKI